MASLRATEIEEFNRLKQRADKKYRAGDLDDAERDWQEFARRFPDHKTTADIFGARIALKRNDAEQACVRYAIVLEDLPDHIEALRYLLNHAIASTDDDRIAELQRTVATRAPKSKARTIVDIIIAQNKNETDQMFSLLQYALDKWPDDEDLALQAIDLAHSTQDFDRLPDFTAIGCRRFPESDRMVSRRRRAIKQLVNRSSPDHRWSNDETVIQAALNDSRGFSDNDFGELANNCVNAGLLEEASRLIQLGRDINIRSILLARAKLAYRQNEYEQAAELWRTLEENYPAHRREATIFSARIAVAMGNSALAEQLYEKSISENGASEEAFRFIVQHAINEERFDEARSHLARLAKQLPESASMGRGLLAHLRCASNELAEAMEILEQGIVEFPQDANHHLQLIDMLIDRDDMFSETERAIDRALSSFPKDSRFLARRSTLQRNKLERAERKLGADDVDGALALVEEGIAAAPDDANLQLRLIDMLIDRKDMFSETERAIDRALNCFPEDQRVVARKVALLRTQLQELTETPDPLLVQSTLAEVAKISDRIDLKSYQQLSNILLLSGQFREADQLLAMAAAQFAREPALVQLSAALQRVKLQSLTRNRDQDLLDSALAEIEKIADYLDLSESHLLINALIAAREFPEAEKLLEGADAKFGYAPDLHQARAVLEYRRGHFAKSDSLWISLAEKHPKKWRTATTYRARLAFSDNRRSEAAGLFAELWDRHPDHQEAAIFLLRERINNGDLAEAERLRDEIVERLPKSRLVASADAALDAAKGNVQRASETLEGAIAEWSKETDVRLQLIDMLIRHRQAKQALEVIDEAMPLFPSDVRFVDRKLTILSESGAFDEQLALVERLLSAFPRRVDLYLRKARCQYNMGLRHEAVETCREGVELDVNNADFWQLGLRSLLHLNEPQQADDFLDYGLRKFPKDNARDRLMRAKLLYAGERYAQALKSAEIALQHAPDLEEAQLFMARTTEQIGDWQSALDLYLRIDFSPANRMRVARDMSRLSHAVNYAAKAEIGGDEPTNIWNRLRTIPSRLLGMPAHIPSTAKTRKRNYPHAVFKEAAARSAAMPHYHPQALIMHVTSSLGPGGAERQLSTSAKAQMDGTKPRRLIVIAKSVSKYGNRDFFHADLTNAGVDIRSLEEISASGKVRNLLASGSEHHNNLTLLATLPPDAAQFALPLYEQIIRHRPSVLHLWQDFTCVVGGLVGLLAGAPRIVLSTRSTRPIERQRARPYLHDGFLALLSLPHIEMINNSKNGARDYLDWLGDPRLPVSTVYNGYDFAAMRARASAEKAAAIRERLKCGPDTILLGGVMRLSAEKRPDLWVESAIEIVRQHDDCRAVLVGQGPRSPILQKRVEEAGLGDRIILAGGQTPVEPWMMAMDLLLLTSVTEGLPNVLIEAQSLGTPVASTNVGGASETLVEGETGVLVPAQTDGAEIASILSPLLDDKTRLAAMGKTASEWVTQTFSIEATLDALDRVYNAPPRSATPPSD